MTSLGTLEIGLKLERSELDASLQRLKTDLNNLSQNAPKIKVSLDIDPASLQNLKQINRVYEQVQNQLKPLEVKVDDKALTGLNEHLESKRTHLKDVQSFFNSSPLTPRIEGKDLTALNQQLDLTEAKYKSLDKQLSGHPHYDIDIQEVKTIKLVEGKEQGQLSQEHSPKQLLLKGTEPNQLRAQEKSLAGEEKQQVKIDSGIKQILSVDIEKIVTAIDALPDKITDKLGQRLDPKQNIVTKAAKFTEKAIDKTVGLATKPFQVIGSAVTGAISSPIKAVGSIAGKVGNTLLDAPLQGVFAGLTQGTGEKVAKGLGAVLQQTLGKSLGGVDLIAEKTASGLVANLQKVTTEGFITGLSEIPQLKALQVFLPKDFFKEYLTELEKNITEVTQGVQSFIENDLKNALNPLDVDVKHFAAVDDTNKQKKQEKAKARKGVREESKKALREVLEAKPEQEESVIKQEIKQKESTISEAEEKRQAAFEVLNQARLQNELPTQEVEQQPFQMPLHLPKERELELVENRQDAISIGAMAPKNNNPLNISEQPISPTAPVNKREQIQDAKTELQSLQSQFSKHETESKPIDLSREVAEQQLKQSVAYKDEQGIADAKKKIEDISVLQAKAEEKKQLLSTSIEQKKEIIRQDPREKVALAKNDLAANQKALKEHEIDSMPIVSAKEFADRKLQESLSTGDKTGIDDAQQRLKTIIPAYEKAEEKRKALESTIERNKEDVRLDPVEKIALAKADLKASKAKLDQQKPIVRTLQDDHALAVENMERANKSKDPIFVEGAKARLVSSASQLNKEESKQTELYLETQKHQDYLDQSPPELVAAHDEFEKQSQVINRAQSGINELQSKLPDIEKRKKTRNKKAKQLKQKEQELAPETVNPEYHAILTEMNGGVPLDREKIPQLVTDDEFLKKNNASGMYRPEVNQLSITSDVAARMESGKLTHEDKKTLRHELQHGFDADFGSAEGIDSIRENRLLGKTEFSAEELNSSTPTDKRTLDNFASGYESDKYNSELNAEGIARRFQARDILQEKIGDKGRNLENTPAVSTLNNLGEAVNSYQAKDPRQQQILDELQKQVIALTNKFHENKALFERGATSGNEHEAVSAYNALENLSKEINAVALSFDKLHSQNTDGDKPSVQAFNESHQKLAQSELQKQVGIGGTGLLENNPSLSGLGKYKGFLNEFPQHLVEDPKELTELKIELLTLIKEVEQNAGLIVSGATNGNHKDAVPALNTLNNLTERGQSIQAKIKTYASESNANYQKKQQQVSHQSLQNDIGVDGSRIGEIAAPLQENHAALHEIIQASQDYGLHPAIAEKAQSLAQENESLNTELEKGKPLLAQAASEHGVDMAQDAQEFINSIKSRIEKITETIAKLETIAVELIEEKLNNQSLPQEDSILPPQNDTGLPIGIDSTKLPDEVTSSQNIPTSFDQHSEAIKAPPLPVEAAPAENITSQLGPEQVTAIAKNIEKFNTGLSRVSEAIATAESLSNSLPAMADVYKTIASNMLTRIGTDLKALPESSQDVASQPQLNRQKGLITTYEKKLNNINTSEKSSPVLTQEVTKADATKALRKDQSAYQAFGSINTLLSSPHFANLPQEKQIPIIAQSLQAVDEGRQALTIAKEKKGVIKGSQGKQFNEVFDSIESQAKGFLNANNINLNGTGKNIVEGLEKGLVSEASNLKSLMESIGRIPEEAVRKVTKTQSPSKSFWAIGIDLITGAIGGAKEASQSLFELMHDIGKESSDAFSNGLKLDTNLAIPNEKIAKQINNEQVETQKTLSVPDVNAPFENNKKRPQISPDPWLDEPSKHLILPVPSISSIEVPFKAPDISPDPWLDELPKNPHPVLPVPSLENIATTIKTEKVIPRVSSLDDALSENDPSINLNRKTRPRTNEERLNEIESSLPPTDAEKLAAIEKTLPPTDPRLLPPTIQQLNETKLKEIESEIPPTMAEDLPSPIVKDHTFEALHKPSLIDKAGYFVDDAKNAAKREIAHAKIAINDNLPHIKDAMGEGIKNTLNMLGAVKLLQMGFEAVAASIQQGIFAIVSMANASLQVAENLERVRIRLSAVEGSSIKSKETFNDFAAQSKKLGTNLEDTTNSYIDFKQATTQTALEPQSKAIIDQFNASFTAQQLDQNSKNQAMGVITDIASRGEITPGVLTRQLPHAFSGGLGIAARSQGLTQAQFIEEAKQGGIDSTKFISQFANQANKEAQGNLDVSMASPLTKIDQFKSRITVLQDSLGSGTLQAIGAIIPPLNNLFDLFAKNADVINALAIGIGIKLAMPIISSTRLIAGFTSSILGLFNISKAQLFDGMISGLGKLGTAFTKLSVQMALIFAAYKVGEYIWRGATGADEGIKQGLAASQKRVEDVNRVKEPEKSYNVDTLAPTITGDYTKDLAVSRKKIEDYNDPAKNNYRNLDGISYIAESIKTGWQHTYEQPLQVAEGERNLKNIDSDLMTGRAFLDSKELKKYDNPEFADSTQKELGNLRSKELELNSQKIYQETHGQADQAVVTTKNLAKVQQQEQKLIADKFPEAALAQKQLDHLENEVLPSLEKSNFSPEIKKVRRDDALNQISELKPKLEQLNNIVKESSTTWLTLSQSIFEVGKALANLDFKAARDLTLSQIVNTKGQVSGSLGEQGTQLNQLQADLNIGKVRERKANSLVSTQEISLENTLGEKLNNSSTTASQYLAEKGQFGQDFLQGVKSGDISPQAIQAELDKHKDDGLYNGALRASLSLGKEAATDRQNQLNQAKENLDKELQIIKVEVEITKASKLRFSSLAQSLAEMQLAQSEINKTQSVTNLNRLQAVGGIGSIAVGQQTAQINAVDSTSKLAAITTELGALGASLNQFDPNTVKTFKEFLGVSQDTNLKDYLSKTSSASINSRFENLSPQQKGQLETNGNLQALQVSAAKYADTSTQSRQTGLEQSDALKQVQESKVNAQDTLIGLARQIRGVKESFDSFGRSLNKQLLDAQNALKEAQDSLATNQIKNQLQGLITPGSNGVFRELNSIITDYLSQVNQINSQSGKLQSDKLSVEDQTIQLTQQIRGIEEQRLDTVRTMAKELTGTASLLSGESSKQLSLWNTITSNIGNATIQADRIVDIFKGIGDKLQGVLSQKPTVAPVNKDIKPVAIPSGAIVQTKVNQATIDPSQYPNQKVNFSQKELAHKKVVVEVYKVQGKQELNLPPTDLSNINDQILPPVVQPQPKPTFVNQTFGHEIKASFYDEPSSSDRRQKSAYGYDISDGHGGIAVPMSDNGLYKGGKRVRVTDLDTHKTINTVIKDIGNFGNQGKYTNRHADLGYEEARALNPNFEKQGLLRVKIELIDAQGQVIAQDKPIKLPDTHIVVKESVYRAPVKVADTIPKPIEDPNYSQTEGLGQFADNRLTQNIANVPTPPQETLSPIQPVTPAVVDTIVTPAVVDEIVRKENSYKHPDINKPIGVNIPVNAPVIPQSQYSNQIGQVRDLSNKKIAVEQQNQVELKTSANYTAVDKLVKLKQDTEDKIISLQRQVITSGFNADDLSQKAKGYVTFSEEILKTARDTTQEYTNQSNALADQIKQLTREKELTDKGIETITATYNKALIDKQVTPALQKEYDTVTATGKVRNTQIDSSIVDITKQKQKIDNSNSQATQSAQARATLDKTYSSQQGINGIQTSLLEAQSNQGDPFGSLGEEAAILKAKLDNLGRSRDAEYMIQQLGGEATLGAAKVAELRNAVDETNKLTLKDAALNGNKFASSFQQGFQNIISGALDFSQSPLQVLADGLRTIFSGITQEVAKNLSKSLTDFVFGLNGVTGTVAENNGGIDPRAILGTQSKPSFIDNQSTFALPEFKTQSIPSVLPSDNFALASQSIKIPDFVSNNVNPATTALSQAAPNVLDTSFTALNEQTVLLIGAFSTLTNQITSQGIGHTASSLSGGLNIPNPLSFLNSPSFGLGTESLGNLTAPVTSGLSEALSGGFTGILSGLGSLFGFNKGGLVKNYASGGQVDSNNIIPSGAIANYASGGIVNNHASIGKAAVDALNREQMASGVTPVLAALTPGEYIVPRNEVPSYLAAKQAGVIANYASGGQVKPYLQAQPQQGVQVRNFANGGLVGTGAISNQSSNTSNVNNNGVTVQNNWSINYQPGNQDSLSDSQVQARNQAQIERSAKRFSTN